MTLEVKPVYQPMCCDEIREVTADNEAGRFFAATGGCFWSKMQDHGRQN